jgi:RNA polymerase sigma-70 factor (ECF subfamily)
VSVVLSKSLSWAVTLGGRKGDLLEARSNESLSREWVRTGDDDLFHVLVQRYRNRVFRLVASVLGPGNEAESEDVAQEVFVLVYRKIDTYRHDCNFSTWLFRVAKNRALDRRRQARLRHPHVGDDELRSIPAPGRSNDPELAAMAAERRASIVEQIERLPDPQRTVIYLYYWMGSGVADIARLLEMKVQTVKSHLHRARRRLAREMDCSRSDHV